MHGHRADRCPGSRLKGHAGKTRRQPCTFSLTGGTGLMGRRLCACWRQAGHRLTVFSRRPQQVESLCGVGVRGIDRFDEYGDQPLDAVVNLAGAPIADKPWSHKRKALLWESRVRLTERLVEWLTLVSSAGPSVIGFCGGLVWRQRRAPGDRGGGRRPARISPASYAPSLEQIAREAESSAPVSCCCAPAWCWPPRAASSGACCRSTGSAWADRW